MPGPLVQSPSEPVSLLNLDLDMPLKQRPRSADIGGLALAMRGEGSGTGWGGWDTAQLENTSFAEILGAMHTETNRVLDLPVNLPWSVLPTAERHAELVAALDSWDFEPRALTDDEVLYCAELLFESLLRIEGMQTDVGVSINQLRPFLRQLSSIYRPANQYHNFRHALDVLQATFTFLSRARILPRLSVLELYPKDRCWKRDRAPGMLNETLRNVDLFILYIVSIGHDVGHPGLSNMFLKNADTPLAQVYAGQSPLERMHCFFLAQLMRRHGMSRLLSEDGVHSSDLRHLLVQTLLVTDLRLHFDWMARFRRLGDPAVCAATPEKERRVLLCQALLKSADISNPLRPYPSAQHWSNVLHEEWTSQAGLEVYLEQPVSMAASAGDERKQADVQIAFIDTFAQPLFTAVSDVVPEMKEFAQQCAENRKTWVLRSSAAPPTSPNPSSPSTLPLPPRIDTEVDTSSYDGWFRSVFPLSLPPSLLQTDSRGDLIPTPASASKRFSIACALDLDQTPKFPNPAAFRVQPALGPRPSVVSDGAWSERPPTPAFSYGRSPAHSLASTDTASSALRSPGQSSRSSLASVIPMSMSPLNINMDMNMMKDRDDELSPSLRRPSGVMIVRSAFKAACRTPKINVGQWLRPGHRS
ncbi:HD-domain/PDEase-like protein [Exidia glandulosa HHB12029]|uniref:Phosphodiesterase n=1 Tax=Exidia glandulosa HHB12029 TaxID=1314781 RepID=A0A165I804_EXIGL|nr:HD-domain/PDEase-like protein [Exidia glandulosa HHB12029]